MQLSESVIENPQGKNALFFEEEMMVEYIRTLTINYVLRFVKKGDLLESMNYKKVSKIITKRRNFALGPSKYIFFESHTIKV